MVNTSLLKDNISDAYAYHKVVLDNGQVVDYIFIDINDKFTEFTGLGEEILNKRATDVLPGIENSSFDWIGIYGEIAQNGGKKTFSAYSEPLGKWYEVKVYSDKQDYFVTLFQDVTYHEEKKLLDKILDYTIKCQHLSAEDLDYDFFTKSIKEITGAKYVVLNLVSQEDYNVTITKSVSGISDKIKRSLENFGFQPKGAKWKTNHEGLGIKDKLSRVNDIVASEFVGDYYTMEMSYLDDILGSVSIIMPKGASLKYKEAVEMYINHIASTLKRLQLEQDLIEKVKEQELLLDNIETQVWYQKDIETYGNINKAHSEFLGIEKHKLENKSLWEVLSKEEVEVCLEGNRQVFEEKRQIKTEEWVANKNGEERLLAITKTPKLNKDGEVEFVIFSAEDITDRKELEEELKLQAQMLDIAPGAIMVHDFQGNILYANQKTFEIHGYAEEEFMNKTLHEIDTPETQELIPLRMEEIRRKGEAFFEVEHYRKDGSTFPMEVYVKLINWHGRSAMISVGSDISERKKVEKELQKSKKKYEKLAEEAPIGIMTCDNLGDLNYINNQMLRYLGSPDEKKTKEINLLEFHLLRQSEFSNRLKECLNSGEIKDFEMEYTSFWGKHLWVKIYISPLLEDNVITGAQIIADDITERKQYENKIQFLSFHDSLTGLYNRAYIEEEMKRLDTKRQLPISMLMADLNGLKLVNDAYGHKTGDKMIKKAAEILKDSCRKEDIIARWGGDEFVVLLPMTSKKSAEEIAKRVLCNCENSFIKTIPVSMSLGYATKDSFEIDLEDVLVKAENYMYKQKIAESKSKSGSVLLALLRTLQAKSFETEEHVQRMQKIGLKIGEKIGLPNEELNRLKVAVKLHDIGKVNLPEEILVKPTSPTEEEWEKIKEHPEIGYKIARATEEFSYVAEEILAHHERWDGKGYPNGLKGEEIPLLARIIAIADTFDVMANGRPYKKAVSDEDILAEFRRCSGTQFDPNLVKVFTNIYKDV
ncbi:PAS domain S-box protein [Natranaerofaba carboxydovora]|uniref:PAS domain S-box protein n=1 Tax=Natranaerofaba carboxydovora TaxID=2742683 RepID=UPI001F134E5D|nr:PAS domain S-box protein [Natranaerofaba carboxydovora]UMZ72602.1 Cyclic di-GMP phosphodiesterase response regulator RpfG [Natranaerofaba carboxydovora]